MAISVIIPSRLANPFDKERLCLEDAILSIHQQTGLDGELVQIIVGIDAGATVPERVRHLAEFVHSDGHSAAAALNAAARETAGEFLAFLMDDDVWCPAFLETALRALRQTDFVSSTALEIDKDGTIIRINDFPIISGWVMKRSLFETVGDFDERRRDHGDNEWLGRLGDVARSRIHLVESTAPIDASWIPRIRPWLQTLLTNAKPTPRLLRHQSALPLVVSRLFPASTMGQLATDEKRQAESNEAIAHLINRFGRIPW